MRNIVFILLLFLFSCADTDITDPYSSNGISKLAPSPDDRFMGTYSRIDNYSENIYKYSHYSFTNQNRYIYYSAKSFYGVHRDAITLMYEWKKEGDVYYSRLWDNPYSQWEVFDIVYSDNTTILVNGIEYTI